MSKHAFEPSLQRETRLTTDSAVDEDKPGKKETSAAGESAFSRAEQWVSLPNQTPSGRLKRPPRERVSGGAVNLQGETAWLAKCAVEVNVVEWCC